MKRNYKMETELHLIVLWGNARDKEQEILDDIKKQNLNIHNIYDIIWSKDKVADNFSRFYGVKLPSKSFKEVECGTGAFLCVVVEDLNPNYDFLETSRGHEYLNVNIFSLKEKYRSWTRGGHKIHTTNSIKEVNHDSVLLLGLNYDDLAKTKKEDKIIKLSQDIIGVNGWKSLEELFYVMNATMDYAVLRNFEMLPSEFNSIEHGDIDLLVENFDDARYIMNAQKCFPQDFRIHCKVQINNADVLFDLRYLDDDYYDFNFEKRLLANKVLERGFYHLCDEDYFYSLVYHAIIHKTKVAKDYFVKAKDLYLKLFDSKDLEGLSDYDCFDVYYQKLLQFMKVNNYKITKAIDESVYFNKTIVESYKTEHLLEKIFSLKNVRPFYVAREAGSGFFNYVGNLNNEKVFVKSGGLADCIKRDFFALSILNKENSKYFPNAYLFRYNNAEKFFISSFEKGITLERVLKSPENYDLEKIALELKEVVILLQKKKIIHRDIKLDNILVDKDSNIKVLDFQFAISENIEALKNSNELKEINHLIMDLGEDYRFAYMHWDDAHSMAEVLRKINQDIKSSNIEEMIKEVSSYIGKLSCKIKLKRMTRGIPFLFEIQKLKMNDYKRYIIRSFGIKILSFRKNFKK